MNIISTTCPVLFEGVFLLFQQCDLEINVITASVFLKRNQVFVEFTGWEHLKTAILKSAKIPKVISFDINENANNLRLSYAAGENTACMGSTPYSTVDEQ